jgi:site-specific DNA-methyltransferase (adenine-specific)
VRAESFLNGRVIMHPGDCLEVMDSFEENSFDSSVCDPPYHLASIVKRFGENNAAPAKPGKTGAYSRSSAGFMGKKWDGGDVAFQVDTWRKVLRVLKPGAYLVAFSSSRTFGRMSVAIEDAGFITHPMIGWIFGQGFPKAHRVTYSGLSDLDRKTGGWDGWRYGGQALKPALEPIYVGQKPFSEINGSANVQRWGTGALNIAGCRINPGEPVVGGGGLKGGASSRHEGWQRPAHLTNEATESHSLGRWPANVMTDGSAQVFDAFPQTSSGEFLPHHQAKGKSQIGTFDIRDQTGETHPTYGDSGSGARFFWSSKAIADDRLGSKHPTVKPVDLIEELATLVTPPGGRILDIFAGTGTLGEAAWRRGFRADLIEREPEYQADIRRRMALCLAGPEERKRESIKAKVGDVPFEKGSLFATIDSEAAE